MLVLTCGLLLNFCLKGSDGAEETARESDQAIKATDLTYNLLCPFHLKAETLLTLTKKVELMTKVLTCLNPLATVCVYRVHGTIVQ